MKFSCDPLLKSVAYEYNTVIPMVEQRLPGFKRVHHFNVEKIKSLKLLRSADIP